MKALHTSLVIVISAIVILIAALVVLTVFGTGITPMRSITDARSFCLTQGSYSCQATGSPSLGWSSPSVMVNNVMQSCGQLTNCPAATDTCSCILGGGTGGIGPVAMEPSIESVHVFEKVVEKVVLG